MTVNDLHTSMITTVLRQSANPVYTYRRVFFAVQTRAAPAPYRILTCSGRNPETVALKKVARSLRNKRERFIRKLEENIGEMKKIREVQCINSWSASGADVDPIERTDTNLRRLADLVLRGPKYRRDDFREEMRDYLRSPGEGRGGSVFAKGFKDVRYRFRGDLDKLAEEILYNECSARHSCNLTANA